MYPGSLRIPGGELPASHLYTALNGRARLKPPIRCKRHRGRGVRVLVCVPRIFDRRLWLRLFVAQRILPDVYLRGIRFHAAWRGGRERALTLRATAKMER